MQFIVTQP